MIPKQDSRKMEKEASKIISVNSKIFNKDEILAASYSLLDKAHFMIDKKNDNFLVEVIPRGNKIDLEKLILEFHDQLINYSVYYRNVKDKSELKKLLIGTSLYAIKNENRDKIK